MFNFRQQSDENSRSFEQLWDHEKCWHVWHKSERASQITEAHNWWWRGPTDLEKRIERENERKENGNKSKHQQHHRRVNIEGSLCAPFLSVVSSHLSSGKRRETEERWRDEKEEKGQTKFKIAKTEWNNSRQQQRSIGGLTSNESDSRDLLITFRLRNLKVCRPMLVMGYSISNGFARFQFFIKSERSVDGRIRLTRAWKVNLRQEPGSENTAKRKLSVHLAWEGVRFIWRTRDASDWGLVPRPVAL